MGASSQGAARLSDASMGGESKQASKKRAQSLNHLLAFTLPPRAPPTLGPRRVPKNDSYRPFSRERAC